MEVVQNDTLENNFWKFQGYEEFIDEWFMMGSPYPVLTVAAAYLLFVLKVGPDYMKNRPAYKLNTIILIYNVVQVLLSVFIVLTGLKLLQPVGLVHSICKLDKTTVYPLAVGTYYYCFAKFTELLDTIFFVLRKKDNQVTFLHVYHHTLMMLSSWYSLKYEPTYTLVFLGTLNSFVHVVMYSYYALSTFPSLTKYLWWKKYITSLQLTQFVAIIVQVTANYHISGCPPSTFLLSIIFINVLLMIYLFSDFYIKAYTTNKKNTDDEAKDSIKNNSRKTDTNGIKFTNVIHNNNRVHEKIH